MFPSNRLNKLKPSIMNSITFFNTWYLCICHCVFVFNRCILASTNLPVAEIEVQLLAGGWMGSLILKYQQSGEWDVIQNIFDILKECWSEYCLGPIWWGPKGLGKNFQVFFVSYIQRLAYWKFAKHYEYQEYPKKKCWSEMENWSKGSDLEDM